MIRFVPLTFALLIAMLSPLPVSADEGGGPSYTIEDVTACSKDAMRICRSVLSNLDAVESCMKAHYDELTPKCQARFHTNRPNNP